MKGWIETINLTAGDRIDTASGADMVVTALELTKRVEQTLNLTVADWHTFQVGEDRVVVHNACEKLAQIAQGVFKEGNVGGRFTVFRRGADGRVNAYQTFTPNPRNPNGIQAGDRFRGTGGTHGGLEPPIMISPNGQARPAAPGEIPR